MSATGKAPPSLHGRIHGVPGRGERPRTVAWRGRQQRSPVLLWSRALFIASASQTSELSHAPFRPWRRCSSFLGMGPRPPRALPRTKWRTRQNPTFDWRRLYTRPASWVSLSRMQSAPTLTAPAIQTDSSGPTDTRSIISCRLLTSAQSPCGLPHEALSVSIGLAPISRWPLIGQGLINQWPDWSATDRMSRRSPQIRT